jgi:hypothetical protein
MAGAGNGDVGETGFAVVDRAGDQLAADVLLVGVFGRCEVGGDPDVLPFTAFGAVGGGDGDVGVRLGGELVDGGEDYVRGVLVDEFDEGLLIAARGVVFGVVLQFASGCEEEEFGVPGRAHPRCEVDPRDLGPAAHRP